MSNILISVPNLGSIHKLVCIALLKLIQEKRHKVNVIMPTHCPSENNLHHIVNDFIGDNYDYWLNIDSDNPPIKNPLDLVELDKDIVGLPTPVWHFTNKIEGERPIYENAYRYVHKEGAYKEWPVKKGLQKVDAIGTGCFLVARRVFDNPEMRKGAFTRKLNPDGTVDKGNDISFCERARAQGFEIYAHFDYRCRHFNELELHEVSKAFYNLYNKGNIDG